MTILITILVFLLVLGLLVAVHELGHMLAAKALGVRVERYSVGFGPPLWERKYGDTIYQFAPILVGGYVKIKGMMPDEPDTEDSYKTQPGWSKFLILFMGPFFNFLLAGVFVFLMGFIGVPKFAAQVSDNPASGTPAAEAGLRQWDLITEVNGEDLVTVKQLFDATGQAGESGQPVTLTVMKVEGGTRDISVRPEWDEEVDRYLMGIGLFKTKVQQTEVVMVFPGQWADRAGLEIGDRILSVNRNRTETGNEVIQRVVHAPDEDPRTVHLEVERDGETVTLETQTIPADKAQRQIGINMRPVLLEKSFGETLRISWMENVTLMQRFVVGLMTLASDVVRQEVEPQITGPAGIYALIGQSTQAGLYPLLLMIVIISLNLGLINLFPVPALDGGRIFFLMLNGILAPVGLHISEEVEQLLHLVGFYLLILTIILITWIDVQNLTAT